ncbi:P-loop NTPase [Halorarum halobium]|uniref:nucleotide-binding protein n=1 Tax=Halorarum halobium TaxID=3075121 RepID=UPI0028B1ED4E|nr:P-loop NTPase [Halobaculum sp. XH14]
MPTIYAVASAKGGVGKTTTAANLAATLAAAGFETVAVDGDIGTANLAPALGLEVPEDGATLHDVLAGEADPADATYEGPHGLSVVPGDQSLSAFRTADPSRIREVLGSITAADYVVVDTGAGLTHESALPLSLADGVLLVSTPTRDGIVDTGKTIDLTERLGGTIVGIALNRVGPDDTLESALAAADVDPGAFEAPVLGRIEEESVIADAIAAREPISQHDPGGDAAASYRSLASSLTGEPIRPPLSYEVEEGEQDPTMPGDAAVAGTDPGTDADSDGDADPDGEVDGDGDDGVDVDSDGEGDAGADTDPDGDRREPADAERAPDSEDEPDSAGDADGSDVTAEPAGDADDADPDVAEGDESIADEESAGDEESVSDDAVIIEDDGGEDGAAAAARGTVLGREEYEEFTEDGSAGDEAAEGDAIDDEAIPFAERDDEGTSAAAAADADETDDEEGDGDDAGGGILSRLFR